MPTSAAKPSDNKTVLYLVLGLLGLGLAAVIVVFLYFSLSYLALNAFLSLDLSVYGGLGGWAGYALLGLGLGAASGIMAAQRRYRLHQGLVWGAVALGLLALALAAVPGTAQVVEPLATEARPYRPVPGRVSCAACTTIEASNTHEPQNANKYEASNLLRRDTTLAWISEVDVDAQNPLLPTTELRLKVAPLAGHRLVGLRLRNGYCKNAGVYQSFGRLGKCQLWLGTGEHWAWLLPDKKGQEFFLPLTASGRDTTTLTLKVDSIYSGENHQQVALAELVPLFDPVGK